MTGERMVGRQKIPFYALSGSFFLQKGLEFLYSNDTPLQSSVMPENALTPAQNTSTNAIGSLAGVDPQNEATTGVAQGTNVRQEQNLQSKNKISFSSKEEEALRNAD